MNSPNRPTKEQRREISRKNGRTIRRLLGYVAGKHKLRFTFVLIFILLSACANVAGSLFLRTLIDDYISPLLLEASPVFTELLKAILLMAGIYVLGALSSLLYMRFMVVISQSTLKEIRDDMFAVMQTLPIKYYDTHTHGDIMSCYTNDTVADLFDCHDRHGVPRHAVHQLDHDNRRAAGYGADPLHHQKDLGQVRQILCRPAEVHGRA